MVPPLHPYLTMQSVVAGKFEIVRLIGRGGFGTVYEARDTFLDRPVALKTLRDDVLNPAERALFRNRFRIEARAAASLNHPGIVAVYEAGLDDEHAFIAMEYVAGRSMAALLRSGRQVSLEEGLSLARQLLQALHYAHSEGILHRDVKPANILLPDEGGLKLTDFGLAKLVADTSCTATRTGALMGTPGYMSPEQLRSEPVDSRTDVFSAAVVIFQLLTGHTPFDAKTIPGQLHNVLHRDPSPALLASLPPSLSRALLRALEKDPHARFASAAEFLEALLGLEAQPTADPVAWRPPPDLGRPSSSGSFDCIPCLLLPLSHRRATGLLCIETLDINMGIDFHQGEVEGISGGPPETCLGEILVHLRHLTPEQRDQLVRKHRDAPDQRLAELAVHDGYVSPNQLLEALRLQIETRLKALLHLSSGQYAFHHGRASENWQGVQHPPLTTLLVEALRSEPSLRRRLLGSFIKDNLDRTIRLAPDALDVIASFHLQPRFQRWLRHVEGVSLRQSLDTGLLSSSDSELGSYLLWAAGTLTLAAEGAPPSWLPQPPIALQPPPSRVVIKQHIAPVDRPRPRTPAARARALDQQREAEEAFAREDFTRARRLLESARRLDPDNGALALPLAWATLRAAPGSHGARLSSRRLFESFLTQHPHDNSAHVGLAKIARLDGDYGQARHHLNRALQTDWTDVSAREELDRLARMNRQRRNRRGPPHPSPEYP